MRSNTSPILSGVSRRRRLATGVFVVTLCLGTVGVVAVGTQSAEALATKLELGTASEYTVLAGQSASNTGPSILPGNLGVSPGNAVTGFDSATIGGPTHAGDAEAAQAQFDLTAAYLAAEQQSSDASVAGDLGNRVLLPGTYTASSSIGLTGPLTLDAQGDPDAVFLFQVGSQLTTASASSVIPINGAQACNVFWQVGSSATLGTGTAFVGTILALTTITTASGTTVDGRALARNGSVTIDNTVFTRSDCRTSPVSTPTPTDPATPTPGDTPTGTPGAPTPGDTPTGAPGAPGTPGNPGTPGGPVPPGTPGSTDGQPFDGGPGSDRGTGSDLANTGASVPNGPLWVAAGATMLGIVLVALQAVRVRRRS